MGSGVNPIVFQVSDGVDPAIASNVAAIGTAAKQADASVQVLTQSLQNVSNSGLVGLAKQISDASSSTTRLSNTTAKMGVAALTTSTNVDKLANSYNNLGKTILGLTASLATYSSAVSTANSASNSFQAAQANAGAGVGRVTSNTIAASAAIRELEGNFNGGGRAAGRFLAVTLGLGPALSAAFPIFGAVALIGVLDIIVDKIDKAIIHFKNLQVGSITAELKALENQQVIIKSDKGFSSSISNYFDGRPKVNDTVVPDPTIALQNINNQLRLKTAVDSVNEAGKEGLALAQAKETVVKNEIANTKLAIKQAQDLRDSIQQQLTATIKNTIPDRPNLDPSLNTFGSTLKFPKDSPQSKEFLQQAQEVDGAIRNLNQDLLLLEKAKLPSVQNAEGLKAIKDEAKQARVQLKQFQQDLAALKTNSEGVVSPQSKLDLLKQQQSQALPLNQGALAIQIGNATQEVARQDRAIDDLNKKYADEVANIGLVSDAQKIAASNSKIEIEFLRLGADAYGVKATQAKENAALTITQATYQKELNKIYSEANDPLKIYNAGTQAVNDLLTKGLITKNQALISQNELNRAYRDSQNPLAEYAKGLNDQIALLGIYGTNATIAAEVLKVQNDLMAKGRSLTDAQAASLTQFLKGLELQKELQKDVNDLYNQNKGAVDKLTVSTLALVTARNKGIISDKQFDVGLAKIAIDMANLAIQMGKFTKADVLTSTFGNFIKDFQGTSAGIIKIWQNTFDTIANGAADSFGRAIAYGEDLGKALKDVARQALSEIISGMIKLGLQILINHVIGQTAGEAAVSASIAQASAIGAAWAAPAAFASLASFGANAGPADLALGSTVAFAQALNALKFNSGGVVPGYGNRDTVAAMLTPGEGVLNQKAMRYLGVDALNALNRGQTIQSKVGSSAGFGSPVIMFNLIHDKNAVNVQQINENTIRIVAKDEATKAVQTQAGPVVAAHIGDPNSRVSKSIGTHLDAPRKR